MGLVRKAGGGDDAEPGTAGSVATGKGGDDISTMIRQAVAAEIERQRLESLQREADAAGDGD
jgi:hypothetical protein